MPKTQTDRPERRNHKGDLVFDNLDGDDRRSPRDFRGTVARYEEFNGTHAGDVQAQDPIGFLGVIHAYSQEFTNRLLEGCLNLDEPAGRNEFLSFLIGLDRDIRRVAESMGLVMLEVAEPAPKPIARADPSDKPEDRIIAACEAIRQFSETEDIQADAQFQHYKGGVYTLRGYGIIETTIEPAILYRGTKLVELPDGAQIIPTWIRTLENFREPVEMENGERIQRFRRIYPPGETRSLWPKSIAPVESVRDYAIQEPLPGHSITAGVDPDPVTTKGDEEVLGIPTESVFWKGVKVEHAVEFLKQHVYGVDKSTFRKRADCEKDPTFKQVIPYVIFRHGNRWALFQRPDKNGEGDKRLEGKKFMGIGGHVTKPPGYSIRKHISHEPIIWNAMIREIREELPGFDVDSVDFRRVGIVNHDGPEDNGIGNMHVGIVYMVTLLDLIHFTPAEGITFVEWKEGWDLHKMLRDKPESFEMWTNYFIQSGIVADRYIA